MFNIYVTWFNRAPELIEITKYDESIDIRSFEFIITELLKGETFIKKWKNSS